MGRFLRKRIRYFSGGSWNFVGVGVESWIVWEWEEGFEV